MMLHPEEPSAGPWRVVSIAEMVGAFAERAGPRPGRPLVVGVDGRSSSGKTTLAGRIGDAFPATAVVHTDDIAWDHSRFGWDDLLVGGVLEPASLGQPVVYRPPAWSARDRPGAIEVPAATDLLVVEGIGVCRRELAPLLDAAVWVQSDLTQAEQRDRERIRAGETTEAGHAEWMAEEIPFLAGQRPWERADVIVAGTPELPHDPRTEVVVADRS